MCMHAHTRENEERCRDKEKLAEQSGTSSPQKGEVNLRLTSRCQLAQGGEMPMEQREHQRS